MPDFQATDFIQLMGGAVVSDASGTRLVWTSQVNSSVDHLVTDVGGDGVLTATVDSFSFQSATYSGWYVVVDGKSYAVFETSFAGVYVIPYDNTVHNLGNGIPIVPEISIPQATSLFDASLEQAANCFLDGTRIMTTDGPRPIEALGPGSQLLTAEGDSVPVRWVWRQPVRVFHGLHPPGAVIRILAGALAPGCPAHDLTVTADHALGLDGVLVTAGALVNGATILRVPLAALPAGSSYWHVETEGHHLILAEMCPAESFIDYTARSVYDSYDAYLARFGPPKPIPELPLPRIATARQLPPALRMRLGIGPPAGLDLYKTSIPPYPAPFNRGPTPLEAAPSIMENSNGW